MANRIWRWSGRVLAGSLAAAISIILVAAADIYLFLGRDDTQSAEAAIVLGAAAWGTRPSNIFRLRLDHAIDLYHEGVVATLIFTGGQGQPGEPAEAEVAQAYARQRGVPDHAILIETTSSSTWQNLQNAQSVAAAADIETFLIVSNNFHLRRATRMASALGMEAYASPAPTFWRFRGSRSWYYSREVLAHSYFLVTRLI